VSGEGAPDTGSLDASGLAVAIVATRWYSEITDALLASAVRTCAEAGVAAPTTVRVPGAFELPLVADRLAADHDAVIALGLVVRGGTPHFEYVCAAATDGLTRVALDNGVPLGFGLLTCDTMEQARDRSGLPGSVEDKGREATLAALETALLLRDL
jgi:6,7-dimethyl-8-ribityllumazine synthase